MKIDHRKFNRIELPPRRNPDFLFAVPSNGEARFISKSREDTLLIGRAVGKEVAESFQTEHPISEVCLYGKYGFGKSTFAGAVFDSFGLKPENVRLNGRRNIERFENSVPKCLHVDYSHFWNPVFRLVRLPLKPQEGEVRIAEWCELAPNFEPDRIAVEIGIFASAQDACLNPMRSAYQSIHLRGRMTRAEADARPRWIAFKGYGNGTEAVERLKSLDSLLSLTAPAI